MIFLLDQTPGRVHVKIAVICDGNCLKNRTALCAELLPDDVIGVVLQLRGKYDVAGIQPAF